MATDTGIGERWLTRVTLPTGAVTTSTPTGQALGGADWYLTGTLEALVSFMTSIKVLIF